MLNAKLSINRVNKMAASLKRITQALAFKINYSLNAQTWSRHFVATHRLCNEESVNDNEEPKKKESTKIARPIIDVETSIKYVNSEAFVKGYGDKPVWFHYRRNHKGQIPPRTRKNCIRNGHIDTASPCPICRDEYLVLDSKNSKLLEQFISPYTGEILDSRQTGLCQKQHKKLLVEILKAWDRGEVEATIPFRTYNYDDYKS